MSTNTRTYLLYGMKLPMQSCDEEKAKQYEVDNWYQADLSTVPVCMFVDGMGGEYIFVGHVLAASEMDSNSFGSPFHFGYNHINSGFKRKFRVAFPDALSEALTEMQIATGIADADLTFHLFTHFQ